MTGKCRRNAKYNFHNLQGVQKVKSSHEYCNNNNNLIYNAHRVQKPRILVLGSHRVDKEILSVSGQMTKEVKFTLILKVATVADALIVEGISFHILGI